MFISTKKKPMVQSDEKLEEGGGDMKDLITYIAKALVDDPDKVVVTEINGTQSCVIELKVSKEDVGKIIGKQGRTVMAIRTLLSAASMKSKKRGVLDLLE